MRGLLSKGYSIRVADNFQASSREDLSEFEGSIDILEGDLSQREIARASCQDMDCILHHAAMVDVQESVRQPISCARNGELTTLNLLEACVENKVKRFILASSASVYGDSDHLPNSEHHRTQPMTPYAASKLASEGYVSVYAKVKGLDALSLRYFNIFGPGQHMNGGYAAVISIFLNKMSRGECPHIYGDGGQTRDFVFIDNIVHANQLALERKESFNGEAVNIGSGESISLNQLVAMLNECLNSDLKPTFGEFKRGDVRHSCANIQKAVDLFGYSPCVKFREGLDRLILNYRGSAQ